MSLDSLTLFRDFPEDNRTSMEVYADNLERSIKLLARDTLNVNSYIPTIPGWLFKSRLPRDAKIRFARYFSYPNQAKKFQGTINHIVDQSYGHLLRAIDSTRTVVTVHDLIPILAWKGLVPGLSYPHYPLLYKLTIAYLHKARAIIAVSQSTKRDLIAHCGLNDADITVIYNGIDPRFHVKKDEDRQRARHSFGLPGQESNIILITGNQSYKNHMTSFRVIKRLQTLLRRPVHVVWLGASEFERARCLKEAMLSCEVTLLNNLSVKLLIELYNSVDCLLFPSLYEGFGWPPLEAMACGTPVVASNAASLPEIVGEAAITAAPDDVEGLAEGVRAMLEDEFKRHDYIKRGYKNVCRFTWGNCASEVFKVYQRISVRDI
jgi:glycosyltransferase involved in cell wall biosynthesis